MIRFKLSAASLIFAPLFFPVDALAQGASVYTHGTCTAARAGAAVAAPCADGSAVFYNPAALATQPGAISIGATLIDVNSTFTFDDTGESFSASGDPAIVPHIFVTYPVSERVGAGIGLWAPYGLSSEWPITFEGRFSGYDNRLQNAYVQPTVAFEVVPDRLALGIGVDLIQAEVAIRRRLDASELAPLQPAPGDPPFIPVGTDFADANLEVDDIAATVHVGVLANLHPKFAIGARYMHSSDLSLSGTADFEFVPTGLELPPGNPLGLPPGTPLDAILAPQFEPGGPLVDQSLATTLTLPGQFVVGLRYAPIPRVSLLADYQWTGWSDFDRADLEFRTAPGDTLFLGWRDTHTWRFGGDFRAGDDLLVLAGFAYNTAATPDNGVTPLLPEASRYTFSAGAEYAFNNRLRLAAALEYATQDDRRGRVRLSESADAPAEDLNVGFYDADVWIGAATLTYAIGRRRTPDAAARR